MESIYLMGISTSHSRAARLPLQSSIRPPGLGGGCIQGGPFENITVTLGPVGTPPPPANDSSGLGYNPHCITRDFLPPLLQA
jgi:tyrosinase